MKTNQSTTRRTVVDIPELNRVDDLEDELKDVAEELVELAEKNDREMVETDEKEVRGITINQEGVSLDAISYSVEIACIGKLER